MLLEGRFWRALLSRKRVYSCSKQMSQLCCLSSSRNNSQKCMLVLNNNFMHVIVWSSIHVRGTAVSSAPVPMPMLTLPDVGICYSNFSCMIHAQLMLHCVTLLSCFCAFVPSLHLHYF